MCAAARTGAVGHFRKPSETLTSVSAAAAGLEFSLSDNSWRQEPIGCSKGLVKLRALVDQIRTVCSMTTVMQERPIEMHGDRTRVLSKRTLSTVSHALEMVATALGPDAVVVAGFERRTYFEPRLHAYQRLVERGATVAVAYVGYRDTDGGGFQVPLEINETAADVWALVVFSPTLCGHVYATEHGTYADTALGLEPARRFVAEIGFDGERTSEVLDELRELFGDRLDAAVVDKINHVAALRAQQVGPNPVEVAWESAMTSMSAHVETTVDALREEALTATRDQLTGLTNREGLNRWAGVAEDTTLPTPPIGVLMFDLNKFKDVNDTLGHEAGDEMLRRVGDKIRESVRSGDLAVRWGGDEFLVLCPGLEGDGLDAMGQRIRTAIRTVAVGGMAADTAYGAQVCNRRPFVLDSADKALYAAKHSGR